MAPDNRDTKARDDPTLLTERESRAKYEERKEQSRRKDEGDEGPSRGEGEAERRIERESD